MQKKGTPCTLQKHRASRARKTQEEIIAEFDRYTSYAGLALVLFFAVVFILEVTGW